MMSSIGPALEVVAYMGYDCERECMEPGFEEWHGVVRWHTLQVNLFLSHRLDTRMAHTVWSLHDVPRCD